MFLQSPQSIYGYALYGERAARVGEAHAHRRRLDTAEGHDTLVAHRSAFGRLAP